MDSSGKLVFVVDDEVDLTAVLDARLSASGYRVETFNHPRELLDRLATQAPDLFVIDLMMPEINGIELSRQLRADVRYKTIPILLLTANSTRENRLSGFEHGVDELMAKPYDAQELMVRIQNLLEKEETHREELEAERLKVLQDTAVTVAHRIMTPLTAISLSLSQIKRHVRDASVSEDIETIAQSLIEIEKLVRKLQQVTTVATQEYIDGVSMIDLDAADS